MFERYFTGTDEVWGRPIGTVEFKTDTLHDMRSVTKSIASLLYGVALGQGLVPDPDQSLLVQFPEYPDLARDANKARLTIAHALTMTLAVAWSDDIRGKAFRRKLQWREGRIVIDSSLSAQC